jgi:hypothetical protein
LANHIDVLVNPIKMLQETCLSFKILLSLVHLCQFVSGERDSVRGRGMKGLFSSEEDVSNYLPFLLRTPSEPTVE